MAEFNRYGAEITKGDALEDEPPFSFGEPPEWTDSFGHSGASELPPVGDKVFMIDRDAPPQSKKKDALEIHFSSKLSVEHFSFNWCKEVAGYTVRNRSKGEGHTYEVYFYRSKSGEAILASCTCIARLMCKHIARSWERQTMAEETGFLPKI